MLKLLLLLILWLPTLSFAENFVAGKDYELLNTNSDTAAKREVVPVTEFFSFGCPSCFRIENALDKWQTQHEKQIRFKRVPVVFNKEWIYYAKAYYTSELLNLGPKLNPLLFKAIQTDKQLLNNNQAMIDFFVSHGVDKESAESAFIHSTTVDMQVQEGNIVMGRWHIFAVPAFVINNQYKTDMQMAKDETRLFQIIDYLVNKSKS